MKLNSFFDWIKKLGFPCAIACGVLVCAMLSAIDLQDWWLLRLFAVLFVVAFIGLLFSAVRCFLAVTAQMATDIEEAHKKGMKTADIVWFFVCLAFGAAIMAVCIKFGIRVSFSLILGMSIFLAMAFVPMIIKRRKERPNPKTGDGTQTVEKAMVESIEQESTNSSDKDIQWKRDLPPDFPEELRTKTKVALLRSLIKYQLLGKDFKPSNSENINESQLAFIIDCIHKIESFPNRWKVMTQYWNLKDPKSKASTIRQRNTIVEDFELIYKAFSEANDVQDLAKYKEWMTKNKPSKFQKLSTEE